MSSLWVHTLVKLGMEWFTGSINDAIANAKVKGALFVVAIHGKIKKN